LATNDIEVMNILIIVQLLIQTEKNELNFDSYMLKDEDLSRGDLRLLEVDNFIILPIKSSIRLLITASDVIHS